MKPKSQPTLTLIVTLQLLILLGQWTNWGGPASPRAAMAQIPDAGAQQNQIIEQLKSLNSKLDKIGELLANGKLQVRAAAPDEKR